MRKQILVPTRPRVRVRSSVNKLTILLSFHQFAISFVHSLLIFSFIRIGEIMCDILIRSLSTSRYLGDKFADVP